MKTVCYLMSMLTISCVFSPSVRTAEWCLPLTKLNDALNRVTKIIQDYARIHRQYSLLPIYVRLVKTDDLFLSPASKTRPDEPNSEKNCYIEVKTFLKSTNQ